MGVRDERTQDLFLLDMTPDLPTEEGQVRYTNTDIKAYVGGVVVSLITGSGITEAQHRDLDTLVHEIDETSYDEVVYSGNNITQYIVWTSAAKTLKIREDLMTYSGSKVTQVISKQYDGTGTLKAQFTEVYTYSGNKITSVTRTRDL